MTDTAATPATTPKAKGGFAARLWEYQAERFPVFKHGALIAAFGASAVCLSALLRNAVPSIQSIVVAVVVLFGLFFQLRVADEHKDNEEDTKFRPERPVPRGLVTLSELRWTAFAVGVVQLVLSALLGWMLIGLLLVVWAWMALMTKEFFAPRMLKKSPVLYLVSHMMVMPLIDLYATACDWGTAGDSGHQGFGLTLGGFLLLSLINGTVIELSRKSWAPGMEREGVETYSKLWKPGGAGVAIMVVVLTGLAVSAFVHVRSGAGIWFLFGLLLIAAWAAYSAIDYGGTPTEKTSKRLEMTAGVYVLANYLLLGVLPLLESLWLP
ncbi:MAG: UbiA family prenyltransferase [Hyphomonadaceae bacterium]|nr:UbiA family prenyltransferase [Hyphomonadaceae bacterium]